MKNNSASECTAGHLASLFQVTERRIQQLAKENIVQRKSHGTYDLMASVQNYIKYLQCEQHQSTEDQYKKEIQRQKITLLTLRSEEKAFQLARLKEEWVCAAEVHEEWSRQILNARAKFLSLPHKAAPLLRDCDPSEVEAILKDLIFEALNEMSEMETQPLATYENKNSSLEENTIDATDTTSLEPTTTTISE